MKFLKVLKYEFLENLSSILIINGILLILILAFRLLIGAMDNVGNINLIAMLLVFIAPLGILCSLIFLTIVVVKSLYSRLFTTEGYLILSLPVSIDSILISKIIVSSTWILLSSFVAIVWAYLMIMSMEHGSASFLSAIMRWLAIIVKSNPLYIIHHIWIILLWIIKPIVMILFILALLNIGKINRFRALAGIIIFFILMILENLCFGFVRIMLYEMLVYTGGNMLNSSDMAMGLYHILPMLSYDMSMNNNTMLGLKVVLIESFITITTILIYYFLSRYLIKNKLEI